MKCDCFPTCTNEAVSGSKYCGPCREKYPETATKQWGLAGVPITVAAEVVDSAAPDRTIRDLNSDGKSGDSYARAGVDTGHGLCASVGCWEKKTANSGYCARHTPTMVAAVDSAALEGACAKDSCTICVAEGCQEFRIKASMCCAKHSPPIATLNGVPLATFRPTDIDKLGDKVVVPEYTSATFSKGTFTTGVLKAPDSKLPAYRTYYGTASVGVDFGFENESKTVKAKWTRRSDGEILIENMTLTAVRSMFGPSSAKADDMSIYLAKIEAAQDIVCSGHLRTDDPLNKKAHEFLLKLFGGDQ